MNFEAARQLAQDHLSATYTDWHQQPQALTYGWDMGNAWAPMIFWDDVMGTFIYLVDKKTGEIQELGLPIFEGLPRGTKVGRWP